MQLKDKQILVIGDRVLIKPDDSEEKTKVGLYLPQTVIENQPVQSGTILEIGPGIAYPNMKQESDADEPWKRAKNSPVGFIPVQAEVGDRALFLKKEAIEVRYLGDTFLIVPQSAILLLIRDTDSPMS